MKPNQRFMIPLLFLMILISTSINCTLSVYNAQSLGLNSMELGLNNINFSIANFGFAPFGKTMIGQLIQSPNFSDQCNFVQNNQNNLDDNFFIIVPRGHCKFVQKALNAQKIGAKLVIIMDNQTYSQPFTMADNGQGYKVKIPTIFVNHSDGQSLIKVIKQAKQKQQKLVLKVAFQNQKTQKINLNLYLQSNNRRSYKLVHQLQQFYQKIQPFINLNLIYQTQTCPHCKNDDCYFGNQYCHYGYKLEQGANGKAILDQQIREIIVFQKQRQKWWAYVNYIGDECAQISQLKQCSQKALKKVGINSQSIEKAFNQSFDNSGNNKYLKSSSELLFNSGVNKFPSVSLNGNTIRGTISAQYIFDDMCNTLVAPPVQCQKYVNQTIMVTYVKQYWILTFFVILVGFGVFSGLFILYKRYMKRRMSVDMRARVDDMVSKYIEFYSERAGRQ